MSVKTVTASTTPIGSANNFTSLQRCSILGTGVLYLLLMFALHKLGILSGRDVSQMEPIIEAESCGQVLWHAYEWYNPLLLLTICLLTWTALFGRLSFNMYKIIEIPLSLVAAWYMFYGTYGTAQIQVSETYPDALNAERGTHVTYLAFDIFQLICLPMPLLLESDWILYIANLALFGFLEGLSHEVTSCGYILFGTDSLAAETLHFAIVREIIFLLILFRHQILPCFEQSNQSRVTYFKRCFKTPATGIYYGVLRNFSSCGAYMVGLHEAYDDGFQAHFYQPKISYSKGMFYSPYLLLFTPLIAIMVFVYGCWKHYTLEKKREL